MNNAQTAARDDFPGTCNERSLQNKIQKCLPKEQKYFYPFQLFLNDGTMWSPRKARGQIRLLATSVAQRLVGGPFASMNEPQTPLSGVRDVPGLYSTHWGSPGPEPCERGAIGPLALLDETVHVAIEKSASRAAS